MMTNRTNTGHRPRTVAKTAWHASAKTYGGAVVLRAICLNPSPIVFIGGGLSQGQVGVEGMQLSDSRHYQD